MTWGKARDYPRPPRAEFVWLLDHVLACAKVLEAARAEDLAESGLDPPSRRIVEALYDYGPRPVPQLAEVLGVTRQAVQPLVDALVAAGRVELLPNIANRRSPLVRLTESGLTTILRLHEAELATAERYAQRFLANHVAIARQVLGNLIFAYSGAPSRDIPKLRGRLSRGLRHDAEPGRSMAEQASADRSGQPDLMRRRDGISSRPLPFSTRTR